jgi:hypothetical protein
VCAGDVGEASGGDHLYLEGWGEAEFAGEARVQLIGFSCCVDEEAEGALAGQENAVDNGTATDQ